MSAKGGTTTGGSALELPPFSLDVQALDLGPGIKAAGLELVETENREPVRGAQAAEIWSAVVPGLTVDACWIFSAMSSGLRISA